MGIYKMRTEFGKFLKPILYLIAVIFLVGGVFYFAPGTPMSPGANANNAGIIAKVNGVEISRADFNAAWEQAYEEAKNRGVRSPLAYADIRANVFQRMVSDVMLLQAAKQMGADVSEDRVRTEIDKAVTAELNQNREAVLGKLSRERAAVNPRDDGEYKSELASIGSSIAMLEDAARQKYPETMVRARIAQQGIVARIRASIKPVTDADVAASYNVRKIREIVLPAGSLPTEQLKNAANKIASEAKGGADFAKLARDNSKTPDAAQGGAMDYSFESSFGFPPTVKDAIEKMKPGEISPAIKTPYGFYIVKVESVAAKAPAKLDKKARDGRRDQIKQMREMMAASEFQQRVMRNQKVDALDPEIQAYWQLFQMQRTGNPVEMKKLRKMAISALVRARADRPDNYIAVAKLAQLLYEDGKTEEAVRLLYPMLEGETATQEGADLRMLLGDMLVKKGEKDRAINQYKIASEVAMISPEIHQQLVTKFQQLKRPDLVAVENKWMSEFAVRMRESKNVERKPMRTPPGGGAPPPGQAPPPPSNE